MALSQTTEMCNLCENEEIYNRPICTKEHCYGICPKWHIVDEWHASDADTEEGIAAGNNHEGQHAEEDTLIFEILDLLEDDEQIKMLFEDPLIQEFIEDVFKNGGLKDVKKILMQIQKENNKQIKMLLEDPLIQELIEDAFKYGGLEDVKKIIMQIQKGIAEHTFFKFVVLPINAEVKN